MTLRLLRPILPLALALGLSACGGSDSYPVNVTVDGLLYDRVVLTDTKSGKTLTVTPVGTVGATQKLIFPVTLSYGDEYNIIIKEADAATSTPSGQPAHQSCVLAAMPTPPAACRTSRWWCPARCWHRPSMAISS